jgi:diguanylate cyclase (GGDEF)-like protein
MSAFASADQETLDDILHSIGDAVCVADANMVFLGANQRYADLYKATPESVVSPSDIIGKSVYQLYPDWKKSVFYEACENCIRTGETVTRFGFSVNAKAWVVIRAYKVRDNRYAMVIHRLAEGSSKVDYALHVDALTSLPNRWMFEKDAESLQGYGQQTLSLTLLDISHFKSINETLGYQKGDMCLMEVAATIKQAVLQTDRVYRVGNDQFLVLGGGSPSETLTRRTQLLAALAKPLNLGNSEYVLQFHIGTHLAQYPEPPVDALAKAERALFWGKTHKASYIEYDDRMQPAAYDPLLTKAIHEGLARNEFVLYFQPEVDLIDGRMCSAEVLLRWQHPTRGFLPPGEFLPFAEETSLIRDIDQYVVRKAFDYLARHRDVPNMLLSVNLSAQSVCHEDTLQLFAELIRETGVSAAHICAEIVETSLMHDVETSRKVVEGLKEMGVRIAIDDFGTGYSSISYLVQYPAHFLKIDRSFVQTLSSSEKSQTMVRNIIGLAHGMGIGVVAEGIETEVEANLLKDFSCDIGQGYHFARPLKEEDFGRWVTEKGFSSLQSDIR